MFEKKRVGQLIYNMLFYKIQKTIARHKLKCFKASFLNHLFFSRDYLKKEILFFKTAKKNEKSGKNLSNEIKKAVTQTATAFSNQ